MKMRGMLILTVIVAFFCAACANNNNAPSEDTNPVAPASTEKEPVTITVITSYGGDDGNRQNYERAINAYEATSGNIVKDASGISNEEWKAGIMAGFDAGTEPDVLFYFTGVDANRLIDNNQVVSIEEIRETYPGYAANMKDDMLPKSPVDDKAYAVPVNGYWEGLYVNKKVLAECGVAIPDEATTWEQFLTDCEIILHKGYIPIAATMLEVPHYWFEFCVFNNGTLSGHADLPLSSSDEVGRNWAAGLYDIKELYDRGFFPVDTLTAAATDTDALMINDKAAFMIEGSWKIGWFAENAADINNFTVTYVPGKNERKSTDIVGGLSMGYFITRKAWDNNAKQAACVEFVQAMTTDEVVTTFGATAVTALKNGITPPSSANSLITDALHMTKNVTGITTATQDGLSPASRGSLFGNVPQIVTGSLTAEEAIDQCLAIGE